MIIEKCTSEESCRWLLDFLHRIPNFNLNLTAQECRLISTPGNVLCIGRSGTGKVSIIVFNKSLDYFSSFATFRNRDPVQDPFDPVLQGCDLPEVKQFHFGGGGVDEHGSALGDSDSEPRAHQRDQALLLGTQE